MQAGDKNGIGPTAVWVGALIGWVIAMGMMLVIFGPGEIIRGSKAYKWHAQRCTVVSSSLDAKGEERGELTVAVKYEYAGKGYETTCLLEGTTKNLKRQMEVFMKSGEEVACRVNPADPGEAMLDTAYIPFEFSIVLGVSLSVICLGAAAVWHLWLITGNRFLLWYRLAWLGRAGTALACVLVLVFCGIATIRGFSGLVKTVAARGWTRTTATIEEASVTKERKGESWDYKVSLAYRYEFDGKTYHGTSYRISDEGYAAGTAKREFTEKTKAGDSVTCYVDPSGPERAILDRSIGDYRGVLALPFVLALAAWALWNAVKPRKMFTLEAVLADELEIMAVGLRFPVMLHYELSRRQRLVPHMKIWTPQWLFIALILGISPYGMMKHWWFTAVPVITVWCWRGFFMGLADALSPRRKEIEIALDRENLTVTSGRTLIWAENAGILSVQKYTPDVWTIQYCSAAVQRVGRFMTPDDPAVVHIPTSQISEEHIDYLQRVPMVVMDDEEEE